MIFLQNTKWKIQIWYLKYRYLWSFRSHPVNFRFTFDPLPVTHGPWVMGMKILETYSYLHVPPELAPFGHPGDLKKFAVGCGCWASQKFWSPRMVLWRKMKNKCNLAILNKGSGGTHCSKRDVTEVMTIAIGNLRL